jgi:hypothetical protein
MIPLSNLLGKDQPYTLKTILYIYCTSFKLIYNLPYQELSYPYIIHPFELITIFLEYDVPGEVYPRNNNGFDIIMMMLYLIHCKIGLPVLE